MCPLFLFRLTRAPSMRLSQLGVTSRFIQPSYSENLEHFLLKYVTDSRFCRCS